MCVTFDETSPCPHNVFESVGDKEMEESIFVDEELQGFEGDEDEHIALASTSSPRHVPASTLEAQVLQAATSSSTYCFGVWHLVGHKRRGASATELMALVRDYGSHSPNHNVQDGNCYGGARGRGKGTRRGVNRGLSYGTRKL
jgi:hypothetical protein